MKQTSKNILGILIILLIVYHGMTLKAIAVQKVRLKAKLEEKLISTKEYENTLKGINYVNTFFSPKEVLGND